MLTIIVVLIAVFNFTANAQQPPCDVCTAPKVCWTRVVQIPDCGSVNVIICVLCDPIQALAYIDIVGLEKRPGWNENCDINSDFVWDLAVADVLDHSLEYCGIVPCSGGVSKAIYLTQPSCMHYYPETGNKYYDPTWCGTRRITCKYWVCYDEETGLTSRSRDYSYWEESGEYNNEHGCNPVPDYRYNCITINVKCPDQL